MSFAATLAQDLFRPGRLQSTAIDAGRPAPTKRVADLESFLDRLAEAQPAPAPPDGAARRPRRAARASTSSPSSPTAPAASRPTSMEARPQRLSLDELHLLRWLLGGVLMLLSIATVFYLDIGSEWMAAVAAAGVLVAPRAARASRARPAWAHRLAFPAILAFFAGDLWYSRPAPAGDREAGPAAPPLPRHQPPRPPRRPADRRPRALPDRRRGGPHGVAPLRGADPPLHGVRARAPPRRHDRGLDRGRAGARCSPSRGVVPLVGRARAGAGSSPALEVADWRLLAVGGRALRRGRRLSGLLFLAIPRFQLENSLFLERFIMKKAMTGFNDSIKFGDITEITQDDSIAFDVDISDPAQAPAMPYWRMVVLDEYSDGGFKLSPSAARGVRPRAHVREHPLAARRHPRAPTWTFYVESGVSRYLPVLGRFGALRFRDAQNYRYSPDLGIVALRDEPATMTAYRVDGMGPGSAELRDLAVRRPLEEARGRWACRSRSGSTAFRRRPGVLAR